ncbi:hypothetical protein IKF87_02360 [Candidatus Saccharibacteria bacterium]|nr:hypothetical protein [Candidatus Saccharibacteria bacterium]
MKNDDNATRNLLHNLSVKQKVVILLLFSFIILVAIVLATTDFSSKGQSDNSNDDSAVYGEEDVTGETTYYTYSPSRATRTDQYGNVTTTDPGAITTYFPHQVMRHHENTDPTWRYSIELVDDDEQLIYVTVEACDEENDKNLAKQYIESVPLDLSGYKIEYEAINLDTDCGP